MSLAPRRDNGAGGAGLHVLRPHPDSAVATAALQSRAQELGHSLPALLAEADHLASTLMLGEHGRRRAGQGDEFWQYRAAHAGDPARLIDWRRSGRSDGHFVREREWQAAQSVTLWVDGGKSMAFSGDANRAPKADRAQLLALALAVLLLRAGERVGLAGQQPPRSGRSQVMKLAQALLQPAAGFAAPGQPTSAAPQPEHGAPDALALHGSLIAHGRAVFVSDFLGPLEPLEAALARASDRGLRGALLQVLDPAEETFPFDGRTIFESMGGALRHETRKAGDLQSRYLARLAERRDRLAQLARAVGWQFSSHHTGQSAQSALLWLYRALEGGR